MTGYSATSHTNVRSTVPFGLPPGTIPRTSSDCSTLAAPSLVRGWFPGGGDEWGAPALGRPRLASTQTGWNDGLIQQISASYSDSVTEFAASECPSG